MKEDEKEVTRFTGQPSGHNFLGVSSVPQKQIDEEAKIIRAFAKEHKLILKEKKNQPATIHIPTDFFMFRVYNERVKHPVLGKEITYTFTYTNWTLPISVKKNWNGWESKRMYNDAATEELLRAELAVEIPREDLQIKNVRQLHIGNYSNILMALAAVKNDMDKG